MRCMQSDAVSKYGRIYDEVKAQILSAAFREGDQLPTEGEYMHQYLVSRPTVARALRMLEQEGLVKRAPGVGTIVRAAGDSARAFLFGLAFPEMGHGEIFDPLANRIADYGKSGNFSLMWGTTQTKSTVFSVEELLDLFQEYVGRRVDGIYFAPLEGPEGTQVANRKGLERLTAAGIPVVLIDRDFVPFPERSSYSLVGIDNIRAGYVLAEHYLDQGAGRVDFVWHSDWAYTVDLRIRGYIMAFLDRGIRVQKNWIHYGDPEDKRFLKSLRDSGASNLICGNDELAALLMNTFRDMGVDVPFEIRVAAFDDVKYARLISVPLTTMHQPIEQIAAAAVEEMQWCISHPGERRATVRLFESKLIVRQSSLLPENARNGSRRE